MFGLIFEVEHFIQFKIEISGILVNEINGFKKFPASYVRIRREK